MTIPNSVTTIGYEAFSGCTGNLIVKCNIPSASSYYYGAFYGSKFSSVKIGDEVETIGDYAFSDCSSITSLTIPTSVISIGDCAFSGCYSLTEVTIPNSVTSIGKSAFIGCSGLTVVEIPNSVTSIGTLAFYDCTGELIVNCDIPSASSYYYGTFRNSKFSSVKIGDEVETIGDYAFYGCSSLKSLTIGNYVTSIGSNAFYNCSGLTSIIIGSRNSVYDSRDNCNAIIETASNTLITGCNTTLIPNSVSSIGDYAFLDCTGLTSITIPKSVTLIGWDAFYGCSGLTSIIVENGNTKYDSRDNCNAIINTATNTLMYGSKNTVIPNNVISIGSNAFRGLSGLTEVTIPSSITSIGDYAFADCKELKSIIVKKAVPINIDTDVFSDSIYKNTVLYVPTGRKMYFEDATVWERFVNIQEMDMPDVEISDSPYENVGRNQMILGYYASDEISESGYGGRNAGLYKVCIGFSREQMIPFAGNRITNVRFALKDTDISDLKLWIGSTRDKNDLCSQSVVSPQIGWNEVTLNSPYEITGDSIFIGIKYKQSGTRWPVSVVPEGAELGSCYFYGPYDGADKDEIWLEPGKNESLSLQCMVEGEKIPMYDIRLTNITVNRYYKQGERISGYIYCRNWGKKDPQQVDAEIKLNGTQVYTIQNREFSSYYYYSFTPQDLPVGNYNIEVAVTALNGERPQYTENDTLRASVNIWDTDMGRQKVYLEQFTATWCPYTIGTLYSTKALAAARDDVAFVLIHNNDELSCNTGNEYKVFYTGTPQTTLDRYSNDSKSMTHYAVSDVNINNAKARPSFANVNIAAGYDEASRQLYIKVSGEKNEYFDMFEKYTNLTVLLTEDSVVCPQYDGQNKRTIIWKHQAVLRNNVSEIWGDPIEWNGKTYEKKYSVTLDNRWDKDNMKIVAFLAKPFTGKNFNEIYTINCNDFSVRDAIYATSIEDLDDSVCGDVNGDGKVDMDDATFVTNIILGTEDATKEADVNNDGQVNMPDAMFIVNKVLNGKFPDE